MKISERLQNVTRLFLDTSPLVYYVEEDARYLSRVDPVFELLDANLLEAITSPVTLSECLVVPYRDKRANLQKSFLELIVHGANITFVAIDKNIADQAAVLRARYNLSLTDAYQVAIALNTGCNAFLTNDIRLKRVAELDMIVLDDVELT